MSLTPGTRVGPYEIVAAIGAGGMGEVYRARDTKLNRDVALKILPQAFSSDPERLARFRREAQVLASLNHPSIGHIYGFEDQDVTHALVLELVSGPTLAERIAEGPLTLADGLPIARQIADALEAAHEQGIVHRDLKPANIKLKGAWGPTPTRLPDGRLEPTLSATDVAGCTVKVLDFGLAKALTPDASSSVDAMASPTLTARATQLGVILGTAAYMAPEQAKGRPVDKRADIWAFGVVLYEMLTGRRLFDAEDVSETLAAVLTRDVSITSMPREIPPQLRALIRDCLVRDPRQRLRDIGDARIALDKMIAGAPEDVATEVIAAAPNRTRRSTIVLATIALAALATAAALGAMNWMRRPPVPEPMQFTIGPPVGLQWAGGLARLSPDGRHLAFGVNQGGGAVIYVHDFSTGASRPVPGTEGLASTIFAWSPDSQSILYSMEGRLRRAPAQGGPAQVIAAAPSGMGTAAWGPNDVILLGAAILRATGTPILRLLPSGQTEPATEIDASKGETAHRYPNFLPDGRHFFFLASGTGVPHAAYIGSLDSKERRALPGISSQVQYSPTGHLLFVREGALMAQPFDIQRLELGSSTFVVTESIAPAQGISGPFSVSRTGSLAYRSMVAATSQLTWFDRAGRKLSAAGPVGRYGDIELSLDDRFVTFEADTPGDIWVLDLQNGVTQRVTSHPAREADPVWSPDGKTIAFRADGHGGRLYARGFGVVGEDTPLLKSETNDSPASWSRDGKYLAYESQGELWALPLPAGSKPIRVTHTPAGTGAPSDAQISPDGRWIAYDARELSRLEVFIQSFPQPGARQRVSPSGGRAPRWSHDGKELFYQSPDRMLMAATVNTTAGALTVGPPHGLFRMDLTSGTETQYAVSSTGRFLLNVPQTQASDEPITVIVNWAGGVRR